MPWRLTASHQQQWRYRNDCESNKRQYEACAVHLERVSRPPKLLRIVVHRAQALVVGGTQALILALEDASIASSSA